MMLSRYQLNKFKWIYYLFFRKKIGLVIGSFWSSCMMGAIVWDRNALPCWSTRFMTISLLRLLLVRPPPPPPPPGTTVRLFLACLNYLPSWTLHFIFALLAELAKCALGDARSMKAWQIETMLRLIIMYIKVYFYIVFRNLDCWQNVDAVAMCNGSFC